MTNQQQHSASDDVPADILSMLASGALEIRYQPQAETLGGRTVGLNAQLYYPDPDQAMLRLDCSELPPQVETWLLESACQQISAWQQSGLPAVRIVLSVENKVSILLRQPELLSQTLQRTHINPRYLTLAITESLFSNGDEQTQYGIEHLRTSGVHLMVDDFGAGYSSLSHLRKMPGCLVRINQDFIDRLDTDQDCAALVKALIRLAHSLSLRVLASEVIREQQLSMLIADGCDEVQGDYFCPALPAEDCREFVQAKSRLPSEKYYPSEDDRVLLLIDDEPNITNALRRLFRTEGYRIIVAKSGQEGLEQLASHAVGVVISDQRMPGMTGVELLRQVKTLYPNTVRLVLSGYTELKSVTDAINEGAIYKFVTKPWDDAQLKEIVREAFQHFSMRRENQRLSDEIRKANEKLAKANHMLEQQVSEKTEEIRRSIKIMQVSQDVLQQLPVAVIGIDEDGLIVMCNQMADKLFSAGGPLFGCEARERLPAELLKALDFEEQAGMRLHFTDGQDRQWHAHRQLMVAQGSTRRILILTLSEP